MFFSEDTIDHPLAMVKVYVNAPLMLIHKVLPQMIERKAGIIINVSSMAAYFPAPGSALYTGTKSFLKDFTESLHMEIKGQGVQVQCLCPGFTRSDFHRNGNDFRKGLISWMDPDKVVRYSIQYLEKGKVVCIPGFWNQFLVFTEALLPRPLYYYLSVKMSRKFRRQKVTTGNAYASSSV
jgi:short-subunit dehydrogenase